MLFKMKLLLVLHHRIPQGNNLYYFKWGQMEKIFGWQRPSKSICIFFLPAHIFETV